MSVSACNVVTIAPHKVIPSNMAGMWKRVVHHVISVITCNISITHTRARSASEMTYIVSGGATLLTPSLTHSLTRQYVQ